MDTPRKHSRSSEAWPVEGLAALTVSSRKQALEDWTQQPSLCFPRDKKWVLKQVCALNKEGEWQFPGTNLSWVRQSRATVTLAHLLCNRESTLCGTSSRLLGASHYARGFHPPIDSYSCLERKMHSHSVDNNVQSWHPPKATALRKAGFEHRKSTSTRQGVEGKGNGE